ncbi:MAG: hypothetical protein IJ746_03500 [Ruminococcus sp.]|nr:hypothetical protein [Ruminococcus sp.]MBR1764440.1 hypothetical protein [Ruminococcus sp.]
MKNTTKRSIITIAVISMLVLAACGNAEESSTAETTTTTAATTTAASSEAETEQTTTTQAAEEAPEETEAAPEAEPEADEESEEADTVDAGVSDIKILEADADNPELTSGSATVTIGNKQIDLSGAYIIDGVNVELTGGTYTSSESDQNVFLVINGGSLKISNAEIVKTGDASTNDSQRSADVSDDYNFYGINSVILVVGEGSTAELTDCTITSDCSGANAVFATAGGEADVSNVQITTTGNSSRGVYATYEGVINADHVDITTGGAHCAPIATDRGGGYVTVTNSTVQCSGDGSPCIYSTGDITVENVIGVSTGAQAAVIEGKNSITMTDCDFTVSGGNNGVMLYQSMSGDAADSDATASCSTLTMSGTTIRNGTDGPMFYITNTTSVININGGNSLECQNGQLVSAATGRWGSDGSNGGSLSLNITGDSIADSVSADDISSVAVNVLDGGQFTGETSGEVMVG